MSTNDNYYRQFTSSPWVEIIEKGGAFPEGWGSTTREVTATEKQMAEMNPHWMNSPYTYKSVTELVAEHPNLAEYIAQLEGQLLKREVVMDELLHPI